MRPKGTCVIEYTEQSICMTAVNEAVVHQDVVLAQGGEHDAAKELASFLGKHPHKRIIALSPRAACVMGTFKLPSREHSELVNMAEFQFARNSPYKKNELIVDVKMVEAISQGQALVSGAMLVKERLAPFFAILKMAGITPDIITPNTQRLQSIAQRVWGHALNGEGKVLGLCLNGTCHFGFFSRGELLFSREESQVSESVIGGFIEYCHQEFPSIALKEGMLLGESSDIGRARAVAGVPISLQELSAYAKTRKEQVAFEQSPVTFLDVLLAEDEKLQCFDFSTEGMKSERERLRRQAIVMHGVVIVSLLIAGVAMRAVADIHDRSRVIKSLQNAINGEAVRVKELEVKAGIISAAQSYLSSRVVASSVMASLAKMLPVGARLTEVELKEGILNLQGEADDLDTARSFQSAIEGSGMFKNVRLEGIDKRPTESAQIVLFRMNMKVAK